MGKKLIVISAVNLVEAGTLAILRDCLQYLSGLAAGGDYRVVALVYRRSLVDFPHIEYIETQWPKKRWVNRLVYEYVQMKKISRQLSPVYLWFSLHDTSPSVFAERRAVYCHNSYSFYKWKLHDLIFAPKIALFALFTKYIYQKNIHRNRYLVVQQDWFRRGLSDMFAIDPKQIIVAPPAIAVNTAVVDQVDSAAVYRFIFAGSPNSHKNFEVLCKAAALLEQAYGNDVFQLYLTVKGTENKYASWLYKNWGHLKSVVFLGFLDQAQLANYYAESNCLLFPSKAESWGLPISEFAVFKKPMLLADLPYAHETAGGSFKTGFFDSLDAADLAKKMYALIQGDESGLSAVAKTELAAPFASDWASLFQLLLTDQQEKNTK